MGDGAADGPQVADLEVADDRKDVTKRAVRLGRRTDQLGVGRQGADGKTAAVQLANALQLGDPTDVHELVGEGEPHLEERQQTLSTGQKLDRTVTARQSAQRLIDGRRALVIERCRDHAWPPCAVCIARQTVCGVYGISRCRMPSGLRPSMTAFATAAVLAIAPASPTPLTPIGLTGDGVTVSSSSICGNQDARGTA